MKRPAFVFLLVLLLVSCKRQETFARDKAAPAGESQALAYNAQAAPASAPASAPERSAMPRMVIRNANLQLVVTDVPRAAELIARLAAQRGGYVGNSREWRDAEHVRGSISVRVPSAQLDAFLADLRKSAVRVDSEEITGSDVSQEYVDLGARLRNLEATEEELRQLLTTIRQRSQKASEVLAVHEEMVKIRGEIEEAKGRMNYLEQMSAMSTVNVELIPDALTRPITREGWQPLAIARSAAASLVKALQGFATIAIWLVIYVLPLAIIVAGVAYPFVLLRRLRRA